MDTTEELNGIYFYHGHANVTRQELFWLIFLESFANHTGWEVETAAMVLAGQPILPKRVVLGSKMKRTSIASKLSRRIFKDARLPGGMKFETSVLGHSRATNKPGAVVGRAVPYIGYAQAAIIFAIAARETRNKYNLITRYSIEHSNFNLDDYFMPEFYWWQFRFKKEWRNREFKILTLEMIIESAKAGRWLYY